MSRARDKANAVVSNFASTGIDDNADATAITIDSSEIVMTGKTASDFDTAGFQTASNGQTAVTRASATPFFVNRKTDDGSIFEARKDNTAVGSVGSKGGDLTIGTGVIGVRFEDSNNAIVPFDTSTLGSSDNDIDLGKSSVRWNDLYLGGNLYIGGTSSANALDSYEEGTFVPAWSGGYGSAPSYSEQLGTYTKIGRFVQVQIRIAVSSGSRGGAAITLVNLPFTSRSANPAGGGFTVYQNNFHSSADFYPRVDQNSTTMRFHEENGTVVNANELDSDSYEIEMVMIYESA